MVNMRERAELIGATLSMDSAPGQGTRVTLTIPVRFAGLPDDDEQHIRPLSRLAQAAADRAGAQS
jgi:hypothetical protein